MTSPLTRVLVVEDEANIRELVSLHLRLENLAPVEAADIRAGAGLVLAGLAAQGETTIYEIHHIERGYAGFVPSLVGLGAQIEHVEQPSPFDD